LVLSVASRGVEFDRVVEPAFFETAPLTTDGKARYLRVGQLVAGRAATVPRRIDFCSLGPPLFGISMDGLQLLRRCRIIRSGIVSVHPAAMCDSVSVLVQR
jgi:hypothetical protein